MTSPVVNRLLDAWLYSKLNIGVEIFQEELLSRIEKAKLTTRVQLDTLKVGASPNNREGAGLVPADVHDLLLIFTRNGFVMSKVNTLVCRIADNDSGRQWRAFNERIIKGSDGLLAALRCDDITHVSVRGSHTTGAINAAKLAARGVHTECCVDGIVSKAKICERQPSLLVPIERGLPYVEIDSGLVEACPRLMLALARTGNSDHGVHREETMLQGCKRIHEIIVSAGRELDKSEVIERASLGQLPGYDAIVDPLYEFTTSWSGGVKAQVLQNLEEYERMLPVKRKLNPGSLMRLASLKLPDAPRYGEAIVKAELNAPANMVINGYASVMGPSDIASLMPGGANRKLAIEANGIMVGASNFVRAYSRLDPTAITKSVSDLEVRCVMNVHDKKALSRRSYKNLMEVAEVWYEEIKKLDPLMPKWPLLADPQCAASETQEGKPSKSNVAMLTELAEDGCIPNEELAHAGFQFGATAVEPAAAPNDVYRISSLQDPLQVTLELSDQDGEKTLRYVSRAELLVAWKLYVEEKEESFIAGDYPNPADHYNLQSVSNEGILKAALLEVFRQSQEPHIRVYHKPKEKAVVTKPFKVGGCMLAPLTRNVSFQGNGLTLKGCVKVGEMFTTQTGPQIAWLKNDLVWPKTGERSGSSRSAATLNIVAFWACRQSHDASEVNFVRDVKSVNISIGGTKRSIGVPIAINSKPLQAGDEIVIAKPAAIETEPNEGETNEGERPAKRMATGESKGAGKAGKSNAGKGKAGKAKLAKGKSKN